MMGCKLPEDKQPTPLAAYICNQACCVCQPICMRLKQMRAVLKVSLSVGCSCKMTKITCSMLKIWQTNIGPWPCDPMYICYLLKRSFLTQTFFCHEMMSDHRVLFSSLTFLTYETSKEHAMLTQRSIRSIWQLLDGGIDVEEIVGHLRSEASMDEGLEFQYLLP